MISFIEKVLHIKVSLTDYVNVDKLPIYLKRSYQLNTIILEGREYLLAQPKEAINLATLRKQYDLLKKLTEMECILCFQKINGYTKQKLIEASIPFIVKENQIYLPFLGVILANQDERLLPEIKEISYLTQKLLLTAIYIRWEKISLTEIAQVLDVSKMSITRCFDELESLKIPVIQRCGRNRYFIWEYSSNDLWNRVLPIFKNPVIRIYRLDQPLEKCEFPLGGISAVSHYTSLNDNEYRTYAITRELEKSLQLKGLLCVPKDEVPSEVIQVVQYRIPFGDGAAVDPLTAVLSLSDEERQDPRVGMAIDEVVEECINDQRN